MDILDRVNKLMGDREQQELTDYLGLKKTAYSDWKSGKSNSYRKYLIEIAEFFDISIDFLVYGKEKNSFSNLKENEQRCLKALNNLNPNDQIEFIARMEQRYEDYTPEKKESV